MKKLLKDFLRYKLKTNAVKLALLAAIGADIGIWIGVSASATVETVQTLLNLQWLFVAVLIVCGFLFVHGVVTQFVIDIKRLRGHLGKPPDSRKRTASRGILDCRNVRERTAFPIEIYAVFLLRRRNYALLDYRQDFDFPKRLVD